MMRKYLGFFVFIFLLCGVNINAATVVAPSPKSITIYSNGTYTIGGFPKDSVNANNNQGKFEKYKVNDNTIAFCLQPGNWFDYNQKTKKEAAYTLTSDIDVSKCTKSNSSACGFAYIIQQSRINSLANSTENELATSTALRLWFFYKNHKYGGQSPGGDGFWGATKKGTYRLYEQTALKLAANAHSATTVQEVNTGRKYKLLYATANPGTRVLSKAFEWFKNAVNGASIPNVEHVTPTINKSQVNLTKGDKVTIRIPNYTTNMNPTVKINGLGSKDQYYLDTKVSGSDYVIDVTMASTACETKTINILVTISGGDAVKLSKVKIYQSNYAPKKDGEGEVRYYQRMMVYDTTPIGNKTVTLPVTIKCNDCKETLPPVSQTPSNNCAFSTEKTIEDPSIKDILEVCDNSQAKNNYKYNNYLSSSARKYCNLYCRESMKLNFMGGVEASTFFGYGKNLVSVQSTKQCASDINYDLWYIDYNKANASNKTKLINYLKECNLYSGTTAYNNIVNNYPANFQDKVSFEYEDKEYGKTSVISKTASTNNTSSVQYSKSNIDSLGSSSTTTLNGQTIPINTLASIETTIDVNYYQRKEFYTEAYTGVVKSIPGGIADNYTKMDPYIFPINIWTPIGKYWVKFFYNNIGDKNRNNKITTTPYECYYEIKPTEDCPDCEKGSPTYFYRTVDLKNVFPTDRERGTNWKSLTADAIVKQIEKLGDNIWVETPSYSFTLDPSNIQKIRTYNKGKETTEGYRDMSLDCSSNICKSNFLTNILKNNFANKSNLKGRSE